MSERCGVLSQEEFSYSAAQIGNLVEQAVVDDAMDWVPPAYMSAECRQAGEPYSEREDPVTKKIRQTYTTFKYVSRGVWRYCGHCFQGETEERG